MRFSLPILLVVVPLLTAWAQAQDQPDWQFSLQGSYQYGQVTGYVQTPAGGEPGTTSSKRPTLSEIGISNTSVYDAQITAARGNNALYLGGQWINMSGSSTLDQTLISQGTTFSEGTHVSSEVNLDWYRFGYQHRFTLGQSSEWTFSPGVGAAILDFRYRLRGEGEAADRSYAKVNAQFDLATQWRPGGGRFSLDLNLLLCPPITPPLPQMQVEQLLATYRLIEHQQSDLSLFAGVGFEQIAFEDHQSVSNHIKADLGPLFIVGLNWHF